MRISKGKGLISLVLTGLMVCAMLVPGAAADGPSNDPMGVPEIAATDSEPANSSYRSDPPPPPPPAVDEGDVQPEGWWWFLYEKIGLEPASPGATRYFIVDGRRYYSIGQIYQPMTNMPWHNRVVARADTEAYPRQGATNEVTRVEVLVRMYWHCGVTWRLRGWKRVCCNTETGHGDYDVDGRFHVARQSGEWMKLARHRIWRDGILQASRWQFIILDSEAMWGYPVTWENQPNQWICHCEPPCH